MPRPKSKRKPEERHDDIAIGSMIVAGWEDFREFIESAYLQDRIEDESTGPSNLKRDFVDQVAWLLQEYPDATKSIFGAGFTGALEVMRQATLMALSAEAVEHMHTHHQNDPRIPRA